MKIRLTLFLLSLPCVGFSDTEAPVYLAIDAEFGVPHSVSAQSIEKGVRIAITEINRQGGVLGGRPLELITTDNRSMPARGAHNIEQLSRQKDLVGVVSGRFSPVILETLPALQKNKMINLAPWSSADGITENAMEPKWVFRLSLKDSYAMPTMLSYARSIQRYKVGLLLTNTSWGRSNENAAKAFLASAEDLSSVGTVWYNWRDNSLIDKYETLLAAGAQAIILVANDDEGAILVSEVAALPEKKRLPIISHWGVTGGDFIGQMKHSDDLGKLHFVVVQSFSLFRSDPVKLRKVMELGKELFGITKPEEIDAPVGFGQAYDLVHILARAIDMAGSTDRTVIREKLEQVRNYDGLVKKFKRPFSEKNHDALVLQDIFMARYGKDGVIYPLPVSASTQTTNK